MCGQKGTAPLLKPSKMSARKIVISNDNPLGDCLRPAPLITMGEGGFPPSIPAPWGRSCPRTEAALGGRKTRPPLLHGELAGQGFAQSLPRLALSTKGRRAGVGRVSQGEFQPPLVRSSRACIEAMALSWATSDCMKPAI